MRKALLISFGIITSIVLILFTAYFASSAIERGKFEAKLSEYEPACKEFSEYLISITEVSGTEYYLQYVEDKDEYILKIPGEPESTVIDMPVNISKDLDSVDRAFYLLTHRNGPNWIRVSGNYVIYFEDCYYGCMIYSKDGTFDKEIKDSWQTEDYQRFYQLNKNWYSVYIDLI